MATFITVTNKKDKKKFLVNLDHTKVIVEEPDGTAMLVMTSNGAYAHTIETVELYCDLFKAKRVLS